VGREEKGGETEAEGGGRSWVEGRRQWEPTALGARAGCNSPGRSPRRPELGRRTWPEPAPALEEKGRAEEQRREGRRSETGREGARK